MEGFVYCIRMLYKGRGCRLGLGCFFLYIELNGVLFILSKAVSAMISIAIE